MNTADILIKNIKKYGTTVKGKVSVGKDGVKYRYDKTELNYKTSPYWLQIMFEAAAKENAKQYATQFYYKDYSFYFDRSVFKSGQSGKMSFTELILI